MFHNYQWIKMVLKTVQLLSVSIIYKYVSTLTTNVKNIIFDIEGCLSYRVIEKKVLYNRERVHAFLP